MAPSSGRRSGSTVFDVKGDGGRGGGDERRRGGEDGTGRGETEKRARGATEIERERASAAASSQRARSPYPRTPRTDRTQRTAVLVTRPTARPLRLSPGPGAFLPRDTPSP